MPAQKKDFFATLVVLMMTFILLQGCAASKVSRDSAKEVDRVFNNASNMVSQPDPITSYQVANQALKGGLIGGAAGALIGGTSSGVGTVPGALGGAIFGAALGAYID